MVDIEHKAFTSRLDSIDSGISGDLDDRDRRLLCSWSSVDSSACSPLTASDFSDSPFSCIARGSASVKMVQTVIEATAIELAHDIVNYMTHQTTTRTKSTNRHANTLRRMVDELSTKHEILFASLVKKLDLHNKDMDCRFIDSVADRMFSDGQFNWGRIVTLFAFSSWLARYCLENQMDEDWPERIAERTGNYIAKNASHWILKQGGWDVMDEFFKESDNTESKLWRGLLYTALGLGALATTVAVVR